jgi:hypothetical protein
MSVFANDTYNNSVEYNQTIYITRFLNRAVVYFNITNSSSGDYIFNDEDKIYIMVEVYDESNNPVYRARINLISPQISSSGSVISTSTDTNGKGVLVIVPEASDKTYNFNISVYSPLNTSYRIYNSTLTAYVKDIMKWEYNSFSNTIINYQSPTPAVRDVQVTLRGNLSITSGNQNKISGGSMKYVLKARGSDVTSLSSCTSSLSSDDLTFEIKCTPKTTDKHCLYINATIKYDGVDIKENNIRYCFDVVENQTSEQSSGSQQQSTVGQSCSKDDDCALGEYCYNNVCTALQCDAGEVIYNHQCMLVSQLYSLDIIPVDKIIVERGSEKTYDFILKNTGKEKQTVIRINLESSHITWKDWYSVLNTTIDELDSGDNTTVSIKFRADVNASVDEYFFTIKLSSKEGRSTQKSFVLYVAPTQADIQNLNQSYDEFEKKLAELRTQVDELLKKRNTSPTRLASTKLEMAESMLNDMKKYMDKGDYLEAYLKKNELAALLNDLEILVQGEIQKMKESRSRWLKYTLIVVMLAALSFTFYYLWTLPSGYKPTRGYVYRPPSKKLDVVIAQLKGLKEKLKELNKRDTRPKYNFHRKRRWRHE